MRTRVITVTALLVASASAEAATVQEAFDAATAAYVGERWADAVAAFNALEARLATHGRSAAIVRVRKGIALAHLGRPDEATLSLTKGLAELPVTDATLAIDHYDGQMALGRAYEATFQPLAAIAVFEQAEPLAPDALSRLEALSSAARVETYTDPAKALVAIDEALSLAQGKVSDKKLEAQLHTIRGRALLNGSQFAAARKELDRAVDLLGGLTLKVGVTDLAARSDLAIAALLAGDNAAAKKYLAYAASGTLEDGFARGANMDPPDCGAATGLRPDDVAVIEFGIGADGTVAYAAPVYASRPGPAVVEFARAAAGWSWAPDRLAKIPSLFRAMTRIEMRCSEAPTRPTMQNSLDAEVRSWFAAQHLTLAAQSGVAATDLAAARRDLTARRAGAASAIALAPFLFEIAANRAAPDAERRAAAGEWSLATLQANPPPMIRAAAGLAASGAVATSSWRKGSGPSVTALKLLDDPAIADDTRTLNTLRIRFADQYLERRAYALAMPLIEAVIADSRLASADQLRSAALVRRSAIDLAGGNLPAARAAFEQSGLSEAQCALTDAQPAVTRHAGGTQDYPVEAIQWHISGWAMTEFDINADGTTSGVRATIAYPPFVFGQPTVKIFQRTKYTQTYRPAGGSGCSGFKASQGFRVL